MPTRRSILVAVAASWLPLSSAAESTRAPTAGRPDRSDIEAASRQASLCSARNLPGTGLLGEYFGVEGCRGRPIAVRNDAAIDFDAGFDDVDAAAGKHLRSVRWTGWVKAPFAGNYRFHFDAVDGRVVVANQVCVQNGEPRGPLELHSGRFYPIALQLDRPLAPGRRIALEWTAPHGARYVVPKPLLFLPTESATS